MRGSLKFKLQAAIALIFVLLLSVVALNHYALYHITEHAKNVFQANYESLEYVEQMRAALYPLDTALFEPPLRQQEGNITEPGETEATQALRRYYRVLQANPADNQARTGLTTALANISQLNRSAIVRANERTYLLAEQYGLWSAMLGTTSALLVFVLLFNLPDYIARPVLRLKEGIQKIAAKDYTARIHEHSHDEFGALTAAFNDMAARLEQWEQSSLAAVLKAKQRLEVVISLFPEAAIGLDESGKVLFVNPSAARLLSLNPASVLGRPAAELAQYNDLLREMLALETSEFRIVADEAEQTFTYRSFPVSDQEGGTIGRMLLLEQQKSDQKSG